MEQGTRHYERLEWVPSRRRAPDTSQWPFSVPAISQIIAEGGLDLAPGVTFLVGENGSGKSTLVEALAAAYPRDGFATSFVAVTGPDADDSPLLYNVKARTHKQASRAGFFLRAEAMHEFLRNVDNHEAEAFAWGNRKVQERSHGESFLAVLQHRFEDVGVYFLDEPEPALSFQSCLALVSLLDTMRREGSQVFVATHSPILVSLPGATLLELGPEGITWVKSFEDLALVQNWRQFLAAPQRYLRHLLDETPEPLK